MRQLITFDKLKLTNHDANKKGHVRKIQLRSNATIGYVPQLCITMSSLNDSTQQSSV